MKLYGILVVVLVSVLLVRGETNSSGFQDLYESAQRWAVENLDENAFRVFQDVDQEKVQRLFEQVQRRFQADYVFDLAALRDGVKMVLPLLESYEETQPYAAWLKTRLDYLDVADDLLRVTPPPKVEPGKPPKPVPNPGPDKEREIWVRKVARRPWPKAAHDYVPALKPVFTAEGVPAELVWLAEVESSFDRKARSPAGARGLFQLKPDTARRFGLSLFPRDQRVQPEPSARAAAQYLKHLHGRFKDWPLAVAAYNAGEGTVWKLLVRHKTRGFDRIATHLPAETQMYVPKLEATLLRREGVQLANLPAPRG